MNKLKIFVITFLTLTTGITVGLVVYGLFEIDLNNKSEISKLALKSLITASIIGALFGTINMYIKLLPFGRNIEKKN